MAEYLAPLKDMHFVLNELADLEGIARLPGYEEFGGDMAEAVLDESAKFSSGVLSPLNVSGDRARIRWEAEEGGRVRMAAGFREAYQQFIDAGWNGYSADPEYGGQGLPKLLGAAVQEMWMAANLSFSLCPLLTSGAIEALELSGSEAQKACYLPNMVQGRWTGTMNLTEPQAGSDLAAIRARAVPQADGTYRIFGQKIFITYGDHDMSENIVHLVLARTPDAPPGVKGISLFVVPKFLVNADGSLGARNDAYCVSVEHKLGIHACPTCVMAFGDAGNFGGGAIGTLVGEENAGLKYMFIMMNAARFSVGLEGLGIAERAYQHALAYARERVQGRDISGRLPGNVSISKHPDVRRMLMLMKSQTEAMRALAYSVAAHHDAALRHPDAEARAQSQAHVDLMIPVVKGWLTETANEIAYLGVQVHGGMGFIEETGAAQYMRDARITTIYEGTTGIQANDLIGRKIAREGGATVKTVIAQMRATEAELKQAGGQIKAIGEALGKGIAAVEECVAHILAGYGDDTATVSVGAVPFLRLMGIVCGGWQMGRAALVAQARIAAGDGDAFYPAKIVTARFYADHLLAQAAGLAQTVVQGGASALEIAEEML
ncbi:Acyl-CoA dehydrogenase [Sterolibacterium denitrificans]|uniref:3-methylmercaptopropionyl-CoA dehydrogenase n=1 Tax=Sterolibacterium denitrificans TaxID=157592 RepID=A0A7Z7MVC5_9PROT|nr:acyl-CoA dehydrogenase [Sterolibacterium denitrificans]SMB26925.1 Acyl-CoA dehydrogenase [Sterolibacterium denitrificans]